MPPGSGRERGVDPLSCSATTIGGVASWNATPPALAKSTRNAICFPFLTMQKRQRVRSRRHVRAACLVVAVLALLARASAAAATVTLDPGFGSGGLLALPLSPGANTDEAFAVVIDDAGRILVAGYASVPHQRMTVARLDASGLLDPGFAGDGVVDLDLGVRARAQALALDRDGRIVLGGYAVLVPGGVEQFVAVRLLEDGTPDPSFGSGGAATTSFGTRDARALAVAVQPDGSVVLAGWARSSSNRDVALVRYTASGELDAGFGNGGRITYAIGGGNDEATAVAIDPDGRIVLAGYAADGSTYDLLAARLAANGAPDPSFAGTGFRRVSASDGAEQANGLLLRADGGVVLAGQSKVGGSQRFVLARLDAAGTPDPTFGNAGVVVTTIGELAEAKGVAAMPRGRIVVAGRARLAGGRLQFALTRHLPSGALDPSFGDGGILLVPFGLKNDEAYAVASGGDDAILVAGTTRVGSDTSFGLARLLVDDCVLPDADGDGVCDQEDVCPLDPDPEQGDADVDGRGDACDACDDGLLLERATLRLGDLQTPGGDDYVKIIGTISMSPGTVLDARARGARVVLRAADGSVAFDATIPPGAFDPDSKVGWKVSGSGKVSKFRSPEPVDGLVRKLRLVRALTPGRYHLKIVGRPLDLSELDLLGALEVSVVVDPTSSGRCAELVFAEPEHACSASEEGATIVCR